MNKIIFSVLTILLAINTTYSQSNENDTTVENVLYLNAGGTIFFYNRLSANYEHKLWQSEKKFFKKYHLNVGLGYFNLDGGFSGIQENGVQSNIGIIALTGKNKKHFEIGLGAGLHLTTNSNDDDEFTENSDNDFVIVPDISIGYRYQEKNGLLFRAGVGFPQVLYIGIGHSF